MKILQSRFFKSISLIAVFFFTWTLILSPTFASITVAPQSESDIGAVNAIAANDGLVAYASGRVIKYASTTQQFGKIELGAEVIKLIQSGNDRTFAVDKKGMFYIIDNLDPNNPTIKGQKQLSSSDCTDLDQKDATTIVVMKSNKELSRVDITDETTPTCTTQQNMGTQFESHNGTAVILDDGDLSCVDTSMPTWVKGTAVATGADDISIDAAGDKVYTGGTGEIRAYDILGVIPVLIGTFLLAGAFLALVASATGNQVWVSILFGTSPAFILLTLTGILFAQTVFGFSAFKGVPHLAIDAFNPTFLYVAMVSAAMIYEFSGGTLNFVTSFLGAAFMHNMALISIFSVLYLFASASYSGAHIYRMDNPVLPLFIASLFLLYAVRSVAFFILSPPAGSPPIALAGVGPFAVIASNELGYEIFDLQNPNAPFRTGGIFTGGLAQDVAVSGNYAFGADGILGLKVIDISNVGAPSVATTVSTSAPATHVKIVGTHAYVAAGSAGIRIIDISTPTTASEVGSIASLTDVTSIASDGTYLYFGHGNNLHIYDMVDPASPAFQGSHTMAAEATALAIEVVDVPIPKTAGKMLVTKLAYVAAGPAGFVMVDVSDPTAPADEGSVAAEFASALAVDGNDVYLGDGASGFTVLDVDPTLVPVFFQAFDARVRDRAVDLSWDFLADEAVVGVDIFRTVGGRALPIKVNSELIEPGQRKFNDNDVEAGKTYHYSIVVRTESGQEFTSPRATVDIPMREMAVFPNYPNPFNPSTTISFDLPQAGHVTLAIYDAAGRHVATLVDQHLPAGFGDANWNGTNTKGEPVGSGIYFATLKAGGKVLTSKITLLK